VFAVGARTAQAARDAGFADVTTADGDASSLRELIVQRVPARTRTPLLYLCGADISRDLAAELSARGMKVVSLVVYRMAALDALTGAARQAFASSAIEAVLHYSQRSAAAFVDAARREGLEVTALALPQLCLSAQIASVLQDAGAVRVIVAGVPNEPALLDALEQALRPSRRSS
jgi:uroporphyrinogen-III synthase